VVFSLTFLASSVNLNWLRLSSSALPFRYFLLPTSRHFELLKRWSAYQEAILSACGWLWEVGSHGPPILAIGIYSSVPTWQTVSNNPFINSAYLFCQLVKYPDWTIIAGFCRSSAVVERLPRGAFCFGSRRRVACLICAPCTSARSAQAQGQWFLLRHGCLVCSLAPTDCLFLVFACNFLSCFIESCARRARVFRPHRCIANLVPYWESCFSAEPFLGHSLSSTATHLASQHIDQRLKPRISASMNHSRNLSLGRELPALGNRPAGWGACTCLIVGQKNHEESLWWFPLDTLQEYSWLKEDSRTDWCLTGAGVRIVGNDPWLFEDSFWTRFYVACWNGFFPRWLWLSSWNCDRLAWYLIFIDVRGNCSVFYWRAVLGSLLPLIS